MEVSLFHLHFWRILLLYINFLVDRAVCLPSALWVWCHSTSFWPPVFLMWNQLLILLCFPDLMHHFSLATFRIFSGSVFQQFYYDLLRELVCSPYLDLVWMCKSMLFIKFGNFGVTIYLQIFFLSLFSFSETPIKCMLVFLMILHWSLFHSFPPFLFFRLDNLNGSIFNFANSSSLEMLSNPSSGSFIPVIVLFNSRIFIWFF